MVMVPLEELLLKTFEKAFPVQPNTESTVSFINIIEPVKVDLLGDPSVYDWIRDISPIALGIFSLIVAYKSLSTQRELTKTQIRASIKEKWIQDFRDDISQFILSTSSENDIITQATELIDKMCTAIKEKDHPSIDEQTKNRWIFVFDQLNEQQQECQKNLRLKMNESALRRFKIDLFLNSQDNLHAELLKILEDWSVLSESWRKTIHDSVLGKDTKDDAEPILQKASLLRDKVLMISKKIIEQELNRVSG